MITKVIMTILTVALVYGTFQAVTFYSTKRTELVEIKKIIKECDKDGCSHVLKTDKGYYSLRVDIFLVDSNEYLDMVSIVRENLVAEIETTGMEYKPFGIQAKEYPIIRSIRIK